MFLRALLVARLLVTVRQEKTPAYVHDIVAKFDTLGDQWGENTDIHTILKQTVGLDPPPPVNYSTAVIHTPAELGVYPFIPTSSRQETAEERAIRIRSEELAVRQREEYNVDRVLVWMGWIREHVLQQIGDDS